MNFDGSKRKTVEKVNKALLAKGIIGGKDLSKELPELGQSSLYCVTEIKTKEDIQRLVECYQGGRLEMGRDPKTLLRKFHEARWDEQIVFEMSVPGERGILVAEA